MRRTLDILMIFTSLLTFVSCSSSSSIDWDVDVYTKIRLDGNDTLYALTAYAYAYQNISNVTVSTPAYTNENQEYIKPTTLLMSKFVGQDNSWYLPAENAAYVKTYPIVGTYEFNAVGSGDNNAVLKKNTLSQRVILPSEIYTITFDDKTNSYNLTWRWMTDASNYRAYVYKGTEMISQSSLSREPIGIINLTDGKGYNGIEVNQGDAVTFEIVGNIYEGATSSRIQSQASMTYDLNWGESYTSPTAPAPSASASNAR
ncbi:hypothetical protein OAT16_01540 [Prolixibacteraceae bacterium]|nr:hypothetical protein [Prolixibacteraceae bacterium]